jgi:hypothetical protein
VTPLAHGIGGVRDLPVPESFFFVTAAVVLIVSFALLGGLWRRPLLDRKAAGRPLPGSLTRAILARALRVGLQGLSAALFVLVLAASLAGTREVLLNLAPTFVYVVFWLGLPLLSVVLGDVWRVLSPWRALADAWVWAFERTGRRARPVLAGSGSETRYAAAAALFAFVALELAHPRPADPRTLAVAIIVYSAWALGGMALYGRDAWTRRGEGFAVAFGLLARMAPVVVREGRLRVRWPLTGLAGPRRAPGPLLVVAVMLGSTSFDGFSRTRVWQSLLADVRGELAEASPRVVDLVTTLVNVAGLSAFVGAVVLTYVAAVRLAGALVRAPRSLVSDFPLSLVPIAFAYLVAHYFSLFVIQGQFVVPLASDPFGRGWDLLATAGVTPDLAVVSPETVWYVQVVSLVCGHVAGLVLAHDRALALFERQRDALSSQYPMLALMILYTVGGLWLLSRG